LKKFFKLLWFLGLSVLIKRNVKQIGLLFRGFTDMIKSARPAGFRFLPCSAVASSADRLAVLPAGVYRIRPEEISLTG
jgi:hypothetical protein